MTSQMTHIQYNFEVFLKVLVSRDAKLANDARYILGNRIDEASALLVSNAGHIIDDDQIHVVLAPAIHGAMTVYINDGARLMEFEETFQSLSDDVDRVNGSLQSIAKRKSSETNPSVGRQIIRYHSLG